MARGEARVLVAPTMHGDMHTSILPNSMRKLADMGVRITGRTLEELFQAAAEAFTAAMCDLSEVDTKMREVRDSGNIMGSERIAVITALNMANDLLKTGSFDKELGQELPPRLKDLESKISRVLEQARQLEI